MKKELFDKKIAKIAVLYLSKPRIIYKRDYELRLRTFLIEIMRQNQRIVLKIIKLTFCIGNIEFFVENFLVDNNICLSYFFYFVKITLSDPSKQPFLINLIDCFLSYATLSGITLAKLIISNFQDYFLLRPDSVLPLKELFNSCCKILNIDFNVFSSKLQELIGKASELDQNKFLLKTLIE